MVQRTILGRKARVRMAGRVLLAMALACAAMAVAAVLPARAAGSFVVDRTIDATGAIGYYPLDCREGSEYRDPQATLVDTTPNWQSLTGGDLVDLMFRFDPPLVVSHRVYYLSISTFLLGGANLGGSTFSPVSMTLTGSNLAATGVFGNASSSPSGLSVMTGIEAIHVDRAVDGILSAVHTQFTLPAGLAGTANARVSVKTEGPCGDPLMTTAPVCVAGYYLSGSTCVPADAGHYVADAGATTQAPCLAGTYQPSVGAVECLRADRGHYVPYPASSAQFACSPGYFQANVGGTTCDAAPAGSFVRDAAAEAANPCVAGTYQPYAGLTSCLVAEPGYYVPNDGSAERLLCPPGTTSGAGAVACRPIDASAPTITITSPTDVTSYLLGATLAAGYTCADEPGGSGVAICTGPVANGATVDTSTVGLKTFRVNATDLAGNPSSALASFRVVYGFSGFGAPVDAAPTLNAAKAGRTVPLKFRVVTANGAGVTNLASVRVTVASLNCAAGSTDDALEEYASGNSGLQNLGNGSYQFNWSTPTAYANSCKTLSVDLGDGVARQALFRFTK